jgi:hypothetical protein
MLSRSATARQAPAVKAGAFTIFITTHHFYGDWSGQLEMPNQLSQPTSAISWRWPTICSQLLQLMATPKSKCGNANLQHWREMTLRSA